MCVCVCMRRRSCCLCLSAVRDAQTPRGAGCGGGSLNTCRRSWSLISTAGDTPRHTHTHTRPDTHTHIRMHTSIHTHTQDTLFFFFFFFSCRYKSSQKVQNWSKLKKPVYLSSRGNKFSDWSATWAGYLISKVSRVPAS